MEEKPKKKESKARGGAFQGGGEQVAQPGVTRRRV
jgi:hypothetical protein